jgi:hypothetical protein
VWRRCSLRLLRLVAPGRGAQAVLDHAPHDELGRGWEALDTGLVDLEVAAGAAVLDEHEAGLGEPAQGSETVDWPTSTRSTISPTDSGLRSLEQVEDLDPGGVGEAAKPACTRLRLRAGDSIVHRR